MAMGGMVTYAVTCFMEHNKEFNKAMRKMKKQNKSACEWMKNKMN
jgi:hypothetical protein